MMRTLTLALLFPLAAAGAGAAEPADDAPRLVWPDAPETARIEYVGQFSRAKDLGLRESFSRKIKKLLAGSDDRQMSRPYAVAVDDELVVVADPDGALLHVFDTGRKTYQVLLNAGKQDFASPVGVALGENRLFVADSELAKVFVLNRRFKLLAALDGLQRPTGLAFDPARKRLYVADTLAHEIRVFDEDGKPLFKIGARGDQDTQFNFPSHLAFAGGRLYVNDTMNFRIQILDPDGRHLRTFGKHGTGSGYFAQPKGVAIDSQGHVYVADALANRVQIFDQEGLFLLGFGGDGDAPGAMRMPAGLAIWNDRIYVADSQNQRVQIFRYLPEEP